MAKNEQANIAECNDTVTHHGKNIAKWRTMFGMTQAELANLIGVTPSSVSRLEAEEKIDDERLETVSKALGISVKLLKSCNHEDTKARIINYVNHIGNGGIVNQQADVEVQHQTFNPLDKIAELYERIVELSVENQQLKDENKLLSQ